MDGTLPPGTYRDTISFLHSEAVDRVVGSFQPNQVLGTEPPPVAVEELLLPRPFRSTLSQLRSGYCSALNSYLERVGRAPNSLCPSCHSSPHTTAHIFSCPAHPTALSPRDLWVRPGLTSIFLSSLPFFNLPALPPPPPEPPPLPPPARGHASAWARRGN